jgi:hypothetical protein
MPIVTAMIAIIMMIEIFAAFAGTIGMVGKFYKFRVRITASDGARARIKKRPETKNNQQNAGEKMQSFSNHNAIYLA